MSFNGFNPQIEVGTMSFIWTCFNIYLFLQIKRFKKLMKPNENDSKDAESDQEKEIDDESMANQLVNFVFS